MKLNASCELIPVTFFKTLHI